MEIVKSGLNQNRQMSWAYQGIEFPENEPCRRSVRIPNLNEPSDVGQQLNIGATVALRKNDSAELPGITFHRIRMAL